MIDYHIIQCFFVDSVRVTASLFYTYFVNPFETYVIVDWFYLPIFIMSFPYILAITACKYTRSSFYGGRRHRLTNNYRIRSMRAYQRLGGMGTIKIAKTRCFQGENSDQYTKSLQTTRPSIPLELVERFLQELDVLTHY